MARLKKQKNKKQKQKQNKNKTKINEKRGLKKYIIFVFPSQPCPARALPCPLTLTCPSLPIPTLPFHLSGRVGSERAGKGINKLK